MENYGNGPSTGLDQTAAGKITTGFAPEDVAMSREDKDVLRALAERVAEIAASPRMQEVRRLWTRLNMLQGTRPVVFCDPENGWNEIVTEAEMQCRGKLARRWEMDLRKEIFWGEEMGDDKPVEPYFDVPYTARPDHWGLERWQAFQSDYSRRRGNPYAAWPSPLPVDDFPDSYVGRKAVDFIDSFDGGQPICLFVGFGGPHEPFDAPGEYAGMYDPAACPAPIPPEPLDGLPPTAAAYVNARQKFLDVVEAKSEEGVASQAAEQR